MSITKEIDIKLQLNLHVRNHRKKILMNVNWCKQKKHTTAFYKRSNSLLRVEMQQFDLNYAIIPTSDHLILIRSIESTALSAKTIDEKYKQLDWNARMLDFENWKRQLIELSTACNPVLFVCLFYLKQLRACLL